MSSSSSFNANKWLETAISENQIKFFDYKGFIDINVIGHGAFGEVYKSKLKKDGRTFAMKCLYIKKGQSKENSCIQFIKE
ncbi:11912_t:CDS:1, partial [Ambispora gerdemannii]